MDEVDIEPFTRLLIVLYNHPLNATRENLLRMIILYDLLPNFMKRVEASLRHQNCPDLAEEVSGLVLEQWSYDRECDAIGIFFANREPRRATDNQAISKYGSSMALDDFDDVMVNVNIDRNDKLSSLEILGPGPDRLCDQLARELGKVCPEW